MEKIGINKCTHDNAQVFAKFTFNESINIYDLNINQISSTIIENEILDYEILENKYMLKIKLKINIKIIYSEYSSNLLHVYEDNSILVQYVDFPKYIEGSHTENLFIKNKVKVDMFTENLTTVLTGQNILLNFVGIIKITSTPDFYMGINLKNNFGSNVYLTHKNGEKIIQTTFEVDNEYINTVFTLDDMSIAYIKVDEGFDNVVINKFKNKTENIIKDVNVIKNVNSFYFENKNKIYITSKYDGIYSYDFKSESLYNVFYQISCKTYSKIKYNNKTKDLYFISYYNEKNSLCKINKRKKFEIIFDAQSVDEYVLNMEKTHVMILSNEKNYPKIYLYNLKNKDLKEVKINFEYEKIIDFSFYKFDKRDKEIILLVDRKDKRYVLFINLNDMSCEPLYEDEGIVDIEIDETTQEIYVAVNKDGFCEIIKIKKDMHLKASILNLSGNIKNIFIKKP